MSRRAETAIDFVARSSRRGSAQFDGLSSPIQRWGSLVDRNSAREEYQERMQDRASLKEDRVSAMLSVLPNSIQSRLPKVPSIRRTMTAPMKSGYLTPVSSGTATPVSELEDPMDSSRRDGALCADSYENLRHKTDGLPGLDVIKKSPSGVDWRSGRQGLELVINAAQETRRRTNGNYNTAFERKVYLDGVAYLLTGLPCDLDTGELAVLHRSLPTPLVEKLAPPESDRRRDRSHGGSADRNMIHAMLLFVLCYLFSWVRWAGPYLLLLLSGIMRYEREYKVSENVLGTTMAGFSMGFGAVRKMGDGFAGQVFSEVMEYAASGVSGALKEFAEEEFRAGTKRR